MNDKIKLMLNIIKDVSEHKEGSRNGLMILSCKDYKILLDYINNLQQENERLKNHNRWLEDKIETYFDNVNMQNDLLMEQLDYKSRCEKAINDINSYLDARKIINDNTKYYYTNEFYKRPIKSNIAYLFNDYLQYLIYLLEGDNHDPN